MWKLPLFMLLAVVMLMKAETLPNNVSSLDEDDLLDIKRELLKNEEKRFLRYDMGKRQYDENSDKAVLGMVYNPTGQWNLKRKFNLRGNDGFLRTDMGKRFSMLSNDMGKRLKFNMIKKLVKTIVDMKTAKM